MLSLNKTKRSTNRLKLNYWSPNKSRNSSKPQPMHTFSKDIRTLFCPPLFIRVAMCSLFIGKGPIVCVNKFSGVLILMLQLLL